jgi:hypothetical protein
MFTMPAPNWHVSIRNLYCGHLLGYLLESLPTSTVISSNTGLPVYVFDPLRDILLLIVRVIVFIGLRELVIYGLWKRLKHRLNGHDAELDLLSRLAL